MKININTIANDYRKAIKTNVKKLGWIDLLLWSIPTSVITLFHLLGLN